MNSESITTPETRALHAATAGDTQALLSLLQSGVAVDTADAHHRPLLLLATRSGHYDTVKELLAAGALVDGRGENMQVTPLMIASQYGHVEIVRLLLRAGADPNLVSRNGAGSLSRAIISRDMSTVDELLKAGANPNGALPDAPVNTAPLWIAVAQKNEIVVRLLLLHDAHVNIGDSTTDTLFGMAVTTGDASIARALLEAGADPLRPALANLPLLAVALRFKNPPMAALLEEYGLSLSQST